MGYSYSNDNVAAYLEKSIADEVCSKLGYRLLEESEWEYIARAESYDLFTFGNSILQDTEMEKWLNTDFSDLQKCKANKLMFLGYL